MTFCDADTVRKQMSLVGTTRTCRDMAAIDAALAKNPKLSAAQMTAVKKNRADGEALHKAGKHAEALEALCRAEKVLGLECVK